jgi:uncharacterized protein (DUF1810 family)
MLDYELHRFARALAGSVLALAGLAKKIDNGEKNTYMMAFIIGILTMLAMLALVMR